MADVEIRNNESEHRYEAHLDGELAGYAVYELSEDDGDSVITFVHTVVADAVEGEGVGSTLAREALDDVRRDGSRRVAVTCPFIRRWINRHPEYRDLLS
jgi:predicted GNAT family acetyltransferase